MSSYRQRSVTFQLQYDLINNRGLSIAQQLPPTMEGCSRLYLCRHGQTDFNRQRKLQGRGVDMHSSLTRAFQTANAVAQLHPKIQVESFSEIEEMNFGELEGHSMEMYEDQIHCMFKRWEKGEFNASWPREQHVIDFDHATQTYRAMALNNNNHLPSPPSV
ncbi:unnamed protein product [Peronospora destructor]|uniref:Uncharacterized protein n=1 Tax=Peronospora destructor TaxID=86335 RepID=A0AAV0VAS0_9STRA|nr:unnamed protein product [Peronospora destructor]